MSDYNDLIERLRNPKTSWPEGQPTYLGLRTEAANAIAAQAERINALELQLAVEQQNGNSWWKLRATNAELRAAIASLQQHIVALTAERDALRELVVRYQRS